MSAATTPYQAYLGGLADDELDAEVDRMSKRLESVARSLEGLLDERERRGKTAYTLTLAASSYLAIAQEMRS